MPNGRRPPTRELIELRRLTVRVLLALLVFVIVGNYIDDVFFDNRYAPDPGLFTLVAGMLAGVFAIDAIVNRGGDGGDE